MCDCYEEGTSFDGLFKIYKALSYEIRKHDLDVSCNLIDLIKEYDAKFMPRNEWVWPSYDHSVKNG